MLHINVQQKQILLKIEIVINSLNKTICGENCSYLHSDIIGYKTKITTKICCCHLLYPKKIRLFSDGINTLRCKECLDAEQLQQTKGD